MTNSKNENGTEANAADPKLRALAIHLRCDINKLTTTSDDSRFEYGSEEYMVLTDSEADDAWNESLDNYIDECILPEIPETYRNYFDSDAWKRDAKYDGRGHTLSSYDGEEHEENIAGEWFYIYRVN